MDRPRLREYPDYRFCSTGSREAQRAVRSQERTLDDFHDRFQRDPGTPFVLQSYDAASALIAAIDAAATERSDGTLVIDRDQLAAKLHGAKFTGLTGPIQFDDHGDRQGETPAELGLRIYRVANGRFEVVR